jgi:hypothetical protein
VQQEPCYPRPLPECSPGRNWKWPCVPNLQYNTRPFNYAAEIPSGETFGPYAGAYSGARVGSGNTSEYLGAGRVGAFGAGVRDRPAGGRITGAAFGGFTGKLRPSRETRFIPNINDPMPYPPYDADDVV